MGRYAIHPFFHILKKIAKIGNKNLRLVPIASFLKNVIFSIYCVFRQLVPCVMDQSLQYGRAICRHHGTYIIEL